MSRWSKPILVNIIAVFIALVLVAQIVLPFLDIEEEALRYFVLFIGVSAILQGAHWFIEQTTGYTLRDLIPQDKSPKEQEKEWRRQLNSKNPPELRENIKKFYDQKMYDWVVSYATRLIQIRPKDIDAYKYGGRALNKLERSEEALSFGRTLAMLAKLESEGYSIIANAYSDLGESEKAITHYEIAIDLAVELIKPGLYASIAKEYAKMGDIDKAIKFKKRYMEETPDRYSDGYDQEQLERLERLKLDLGDKLEKYHSIETDSSTKNTKPT